MKYFALKWLKNSYHFSKAVVANLCFGFPSRHITVIGVTGTNGKTTTTKMIAEILQLAGYKIAMNSTIEFKLGEKKWINRTKFTTLSAFQVQKFIYQSVKEGCQYVILETSSHALSQHRVWGVFFDVAVITNITREHLDYHQTMQKYRKAKQLLFKRINQFRKKAIPKIAVVNLNMENPQEFLKFPADKKYGYALNISCVQAKTFDQASEIIACREKEGKNFTLIDGQSFTLNLLGDFNIENALAAIAVSRSQNIDWPVIQKALAEIKVIPGRLDFVANNRELEIIIDYAVTPDSMEKLGKTIKEYMVQKNKEKANLIWVFGCCGQRDRGKRPIMGAIGAFFADKVILTDEDPYNEDPKQILSEIALGVENPTPYYQGAEQQKSKEEKEIFKIFDRRKAIEKALTLAKAGDVILITGKGAEETMAIGKKRIPWNDRKVIEEILAQL